MFPAGNIAGEAETTQRAFAFISDLGATLGLLIFGFPITPTAIGIAFVSSSPVVAIVKFVPKLFQTAFAVRGDWQ